MTSLVLDSSRCCVAARMFHGLSCGGPEKSTVASSPQAMKLPRAADCATIGACSPTIAWKGQ
eukprot:CAMPEP_0171663170 /NCGR_PEP_ID=MMETSP0990-20121206/46013_1 /TAXON_ID=483369 /ORGANISM="non described non described, Strain CCMP2098" /LENGTH=61 /DNA_ID=CAMNT_0012245775 /DNA_START=328 /DNA_END=513 /DNA_ORIENTATION=+